MFDALAWVEAPTEAAAIRLSLEPHPMGDWTDDARELVVFPQDAYPENSGAHDYTRAILEANPARNEVLGHVVGEIGGIVGVDGCPHALLQHATHLHRLEAVGDIAVGDRTHRQR